MVMLGRPGKPGRLLLAEFMNEWKLNVLTFGEAHWRIAQNASSAYGKGRHPAKLDVGDCLSYAMARVSGEPLLCVGDDFPQTDLRLVELRLAERRRRRSRSRGLAGATGVPVSQSRMRS